MNEHSPGDVEGEGVRFATTQWSVVLAALTRDPAEAEPALATLCQRYWYPLYAFVRRRGYGAEDARDLTQGFFARLLEKDFLQSVDRQRGRFRSFLLVALRRYLSNQREHDAALRRGGGRRRWSLDFDAGERHYASEPIDRWTAERLFERRWALTLLERALSRLRSEHAAPERAAAFEALKDYLTAAEAPPHAQVAEHLGMTAGAVKTAVHRLRRRYRELLRQEVADTLGDEQEVGDELQFLLAALRGDQ